MARALERARAHALTELGPRPAGVCASAGLAMHLGLEEAVFHRLGHVEVADLDGPILGQEAVGGLEVTVDDVLGVEVLQRVGHLHDPTPPCTRAHPIQNI